MVKEAKIGPHLDHFLKSLSADQTRQLALSAGDLHRLMMEEGTQVGKLTPLEIKPKIDSGLDELVRQRLISEREKDQIQHAVTGEGANSLQPVQDLEKLQTRLSADHASSPVALMIVGIAIDTARANPTPSGVSVRMMKVKVVLADIAGGVVGAVIGGALGNIPGAIVGGFIGASIASTAAAEP